MDLGKYEKALENLYKARELAPDNEKINLNIEQALKLKKKRTQNIFALIACLIIGLAYIFTKKLGKKAA